METIEVKIVTAGELLQKFYRDSGVLGIMIWEKSGELWVRM